MSTTINLMIDMGINKRKVTFVNKQEATKKGFCHKTKMFFDDTCIRESRANYGNRTWEPYEFKSSMSNAVYDLLQGVKTNIIDRYKRTNGITRLTKKADKEVKEIIAKNYTINLCLEILKNLNENVY